MTLVDTIKANQLAYRKAGDKQLASCLTTLLGELSRLDVKIPSDEDVVKVVKKYIKNLEEMQKHDSNEVVQYEIKTEIDLLTKYLPVQISEDMLRHEIGILKNAGLNIGQIMQRLKDNFAGQYDAKLASQIAKER